MQDSFVFTKEELDLFRQWYNFIYDNNRGYLDKRDYALIEKLLKLLGRKS